MTKTNMKTESENLQSKEIISESVISRNEVQSLRNKSQEVISELTASRNELESLKNKSKVHRDKSQVLEEKLQLLGDEALLARNKIHDVKKETRVFKNKPLLVKDELHKIRKEAELLKNKLLLSRNKIQAVKKDTEVFKDESEKARINRLNVKSNVKLNAKSNDSTKISKLKKQYEDKAKQCEDKAKQYSDKAKQYTDKATKYRDEILKLVETSKEPSKPCIDTSKIMNTDKALKVTDNDSIDEKENQVAIYNDTNDSSNDSSNDTKPNTDEKTFQVYTTAKRTNRGFNDWEERKTTWIFWKSHVSELCEKWVRSRGNYAYTRFEEFCTCSGEVLLTNEHIAVFSKSEELKYIDINGFKIFKEYSKESETIFKIKPITDIFI